MNPDRPPSLIARCALALELAENRWVYFAVLSVLLVIILFPVGIMTGNEEEYFQLAYRTFAPEKFPAYHASFDHSQTRFASEYLFGFLIHFFGYSLTHIIARIGMALFYAAGLTCFFRSLKLTVTDSLLVIVVFSLAGEQLMGEDWFFLGVESKTLAYALLFFAFGLLNHGRWRAAIIACIAATYMHFLAGGFWSFVIFLLHWYGGRDVRATGRALFYYSLCILPLLYLIVRGQMTSHALPQTGLTADYIYCAIRNPHHTAPFSGPSPFESFWHWLPGLVNTACMAVAMWVVIRCNKKNLMAVAALAGLVELLLAMVISYYDRSALHLGKFYLFRPGSMSLFLVISVFVSLLLGQLSAGARQAKAVLACTLVVAFSWWTVFNTIFFYRNHVVPEKQEVVAAVKAHTRPGDIVLIDPYSEPQEKFLVLNREIERPTLATWKSVPTNPEDILRWYSYIQLRNRIFETGCKNDTDVPIRWLLTLCPESIKKLSACGPVVWRKGNFALIKMEDKTPAK